MSYTGLSLLLCLRLYHASRNDAVNIKHCRADFASIVLLSLTRGENHTVVIGLAVVSVCADISLALISTNILRRDETSVGYFIAFTKLVRLL